LLTPRSVSIMGVTASAQPKKGRYLISFFQTKTQSGKTSCSISVSQADWCLARTTTGRSGMLPAPSRR